MKVARLLSLCTVLLYPYEIILVLISVRASIDSSVIAQPEGLSQRKIPVTSSGIETVAFRHVTQCLNQMRQSVPLKLLCMNVGMTYNLCPKV